MDICLTLKGLWFETSILKFSIVDLVINYYVITFSLNDWKKFTNGFVDNLTQENEGNRSTCKGKKIRSVGPTISVQLNQTKSALKSKSVYTKYQCAS